MIKIEKANQKSTGLISTEKSSSKNRELVIGKTTVYLTNQDKIYFPGEGITKGELANYYDSASSYILPYLKDRPQSLNRFPNGIEQPGFYQKDVDSAKIPSWLHTEEVYSKSNDKNIDYLICNNRETLIYMANLGCIEINPWNSKISKPENPDWMVIDLDPEKIAFSAVVKTAIEVKKVFDEMEIESYCKTSGATGLHIYIPLAGKYKYDVVKSFAELVAYTVWVRIPEITSIERSPAKRQGKVYLDFLQNSRGQTLAAPYSVRPKKGATVSTPLEWKEVNSKLNPAAFTIKNTLKRIEKKGDLWKPVIGKGVNLNQILKKIK
ncbi:MAG: non-homologous end-joining DNA ligase [Bacteroidota bacterium]